MASRSPSRDRHRSRTRSPTPRSQGSRSPQRRNQHDSRSPARSPSPQRRNGRYRSRSRSRSNSRSRSPSRSRSRGRERSDRGRSGSPPARSTKIVVERLSKNINESHLQEIFGQFGRIKDLDLPMNRTFGTNRGTAYILYDYEEDAEAAISHMHEAQVDGSAVNVSIVLPRRKLSPPPPTARRGANIDPRVPFSGGRGGPPGAGMGGNNGMSSGRGRRRMSPGSRYGPRSDVYRPGSHSPSRSSAGPTSRSGAGRYRSRSNNSYSSRSRSRSPRRKGAGRHDDRETTRRRGSIDGHGDRSRSRSRGNNPR